MNSPHAAIYTCQMCVKQMAGSCIAETDMDMAVFRHLLPSLAHANTLILNGIGESMLHSNLIEIISLAREPMPKEATIGLQSNVLLIDKISALNLVKAGLNSLCLSVDRFDDNVVAVYYHDHIFVQSVKADEALLALKEFGAEN